MVGWRVYVRPEKGIRIYKEGVELFLDQDECNKLATSIWDAQRNYWKEGRVK